MSRTVSKSNYFLYDRYITYEIKIDYDRFKLKI